MVTGAIPNSDAPTGASVVMAGQLAAMSARHEVTLITFPPENASQQAAIEHWRGKGVTVRVASSWIPASVVRMKRRFEGAIRETASRLEPTTGDRRTQMTIDVAIREEQFDIIQAENIGVGAFRYPTSIPTVVTEHEVGRFSTGGADAWRTRQPDIWTSFDRIQVFTRRDAAAIAALAPVLSDRIRVNPFGIDLPPAFDPDLVDPDTIVFIGSFKHEPNVDAALWLAREIMPHIAIRRPRTRLILVGDQPPLSVRTIARPNISVTGRVPDVTPYLTSAAVVVAPVRTGGGMRQKVLQALAFGTAVVTTPLGAEGLMGSMEELPVACADTADAIASHIVRLLDSPDERRALGARARAFVAERQSWTAYADRLDATYEELRRRAPLREY
jgi:glycosyltransferase involved in cell wall biosynthesis